MMCRSSQPRSRTPTGGGRQHPACDGAVPASGAFKLPIQLPIGQMDGRRVAQPYPPPPSHFLRSTAPPPACRLRRKRLLVTVVEGRDLPSGTDSLYRGVPPTLPRCFCVTWKEPVQDTERVGIEVCISRFRFCGRSYSPQSIWAVYGVLS